MNAGAALLVLAATWLGYAPVARGAEVAALEVAHAQGRYTVHFDVRLAAPRARLERYLTDYGKYDEYFESITESKVLTGSPGGLQRIRLRAYGCILFFCRTVTMVKDIAEQEPGEILAHIDPAVSDFEEATEHWRILADGNQTRLQYDAELVPEFFVPPLIGPWLLKNNIRASLLSGAEKLEALARE